MPCSMSKADPGREPSSGETSGSRIGGALTRLRHRWSRWDTALLVCSLLLLIGAGLPLPGFSVAPGPTRPVGQLVEVNGAEVFPSSGEVLVATVALHPMSPFRALHAWLDRDVHAVGEDDVVGSEARARDMEESRQVAVAVALRHVGFVVPERGEGALVVSVEAGSPAEGHLVPGDVVTGIDGIPASLAGDVVMAVGARDPGDLLRLVVVAPDGSERLEEIELGVRPDGDGGYLGVAVRTQNLRFDYPFSVDIRSGGIDGSSAGLAFTLGVIDALTPGALTAGETVGVTGTITIDGTVGPVGSVGQKTVAVREAGADYLLVPAGQGREARPHAGERLQIIEVSSLDEALAALARLGGD